MALRSGLYLTLTRDEVLNIHKVTEDLFDSIKGYVSCSATVHFLHSGRNNPSWWEKELLKSKILGNGCKIMRPLISVS